MEIFTMTSPAMPLTRACAPSVSPLAPAASWLAPALVERAALSAPAAAPVVVLAAERAQVSRVHQVSVQAELGVQGLISEIDGTTSTTGFMGTKVSIDDKRYVDGNGGVPPRGRPV